MAPARTRSQGGRGRSPGGRARAGGRSTQPRSRSGSWPWGASAAGPAGRRGLTVPDTIGGLYASVRLQPSADRNGPRLVGHGGRERRLNGSGTPEDARGKRGG